MNLSTLKQILHSIENVSFRLENGSAVPAHFHITEIGMVSKNFIDCGGKIRNEKAISFQLWYATDYQHKLSPEKLSAIIGTFERQVSSEDAAIEVEYQTDTIGKYDLDFDGETFILKNKNTACLAEDRCGIPVHKQKKDLKELATTANSCQPGSGCC
ncbi:DUF6428 family protein [Niabella insulamsoli]|uniref:DUF6428 family protein n=1 Tax=Niabella insulamsoli TaxID=3144874 RepID=UPI0031FBAC51